MSEGRPPLAVVGEPGRPEPELEAVAAQTPGAPRRHGGPVRILVALALVFGAGLLFQTWRADRLAGEVRGLEGELATTRAELSEARADIAAHDAHLSEVRGAVAELRDRLSALDELVARDPSPSQ